MEKGSKTEYFAKATCIGGLIFGTLFLLSQGQSSGSEITYFHQLANAFLNPEHTHNQMITAQLGILMGEMMVSGVLGCLITDVIDSRKRQ